MPGDITILLPTIKRPAMIRTALDSIAGQSVLSRIARVIVSENSDSPDSESVCRDYPQLPIQYVCRGKRLGFQEHMLSLIDEAQTTEYAAMLHDDDWWLPHHLEDSLHTLASASSASVCYSSYFLVASEQSVLKVFDNMMAWYALGYPKLAEYWTLTGESLFLSILTGTPGSYSTLVAPSKILKRCDHAFRQGDIYDNDRLLTMALGIEAPVLYRPYPSACIRIHPQQYGQGYTMERLVGEMHASTLKILHAAQSQGLNLVPMITQRLQTCPPDVKELLGQLLRRPWVMSALEASRKGQNKK